MSHPVNISARQNSMTPAQARTLLLERQAELNQLVRSRRGALVVEQTSDPLDTQQEASFRDLEVTRLAQDGDEMQQVALALEAIDNGTYGVCIDCEEPIGERRLRARPWAPRCVSCQTAHEEEHGSGHGEPHAWAAMVA